MDKKEKRKLKKIVESMDELESLLTDRISDLYEVKGGMQARHCYIYYRELVWKLNDIIKKIL